MNNRRKPNWVVSRIQVSRIQVSRIQVSQIQNFVSAILIWVILIFSMFFLQAVRAEEPVVHALLFYSDTCPHCHKVIAKDIPPLIKKYGTQLRIKAVNIRKTGGNALYQAAIKQFNIPEDRQGVPTLIVGNKVLVGSGEIPELFPKLIESFLAQGGVGWPEIPGLNQAIVKTQAAAAPEPVSISEKLARDPIGNGLAIFVLFGMLIVVLHTLLRLRQNLNPKNPQSLQLDWFVPLLALLGLAVSGYMVYIETAQVSAVCGPVGDCNTVQQSEYAHLFGIPIGALGVVGYLAILLIWAIGAGKRVGRLALFFLALSGTLFSIYLTFLEPFVIGATCAWCLASAIIMTALLWRTRAV